MVSVPAGIEQTHLYIKCIASNIRVHALLIDPYYWSKLEYMNDELEKELSKISR